MGTQEAWPVLGDLVRDAERHGIETRNADDPDVMLTGHERETIRVVRAVLARVAEKERDAR
jgi:hypothetical protein